MPKKKQYTISLSSDERSILKKILKRTTSINRRTRCTILLNADESLHGVQLTYQQIATLSGASLGTVFSTIKNFVMTDWMQLLPRQDMQIQIQLI